MSVRKIESIQSNENLEILLSRSMVCCSEFLAISKTLIVLLTDTEANSFELCENATAVIILLYPPSVCCREPGVVVVS
jgi:hypothetical protein